MALTLDALALAEAIGSNPATGARLLDVATAHVERYAPDAPEAVQNEAGIRFAGYLFASAGSAYGAFLGVKIGDSLDVELPPNHAAMFRNSGAASLLAPWRIRNAGIIG